MNPSTERTDLAAYACSSARSLGRKHPEEHRDNRPAFERDRDRIIHCAAFRRLEYKTQVFVNHEGDYYRTRLTHSLEVAQIGRAIARQLHLNEELTEALALAHDLGHTPFGHTGEEVLDNLMQGYGGFEHNLQSYRVVDELEERYPNFNGLNLTWEVREGIIKHASPYDAPLEAMVGFLPGVVPSIEAQIINYADEIAYNNHDIDDGLKSGYITLEMLGRIELWRRVSATVRGKYPAIDDRRLVYQTISALIGLQITDVCSTIATNLERFGIAGLEDLRLINRAVAHFSEEITILNMELKSFLFDHLYRHHKVDKMRVKAEIFITRLFETYLRYPNLLPPKYQTRFDTCGIHRVVCDYIAGMTDRFALDEYKRLFEPYERV
ncbi:deoxyguanosinetriphosphate triphosphohydrolase [Geobacter sp. SVR]|uniref:deoxyguanosinetriphosphate triphosphohydrolase n=1 Tax=Geobacter sp. SVR TaxID=2495594 RepID=UPI00143F04D7|nr:deoxyguanosinetriphosphate triphosphohydrolase [Geobacter sp. SVR]BCS54480.1 deoxyguanosinetriphosphate triphosphohydrolase-like protein [Geobacter sp. SVR]GCF87079.1 deoxyguanosinetriphosphate triphosphohydrolase-like protein [Geobacter sp. SVR]